MRPVWKLFARSPFGPIREQMDQIMACVRMLRPLFEAACAGDPAHLAEVVEQIKQLESEADQAKNEIRNHLPKALFLPVDRRDLLEIVHFQDGVADSLREAAEMLTLKPLTVPASLSEELLAFADGVLAVCERAAELMGHLDQLVEATFGGPEAATALSLIEEMDAAESKSDVLGRRLLQRLFQVEEELGAVDVMLWYQIIQLTAEVANNAERASNRLRLLIATA